MDKRVASTWNITKQTFKEFVDDNPLDYAAIIGFYTIFSLPAVLIITIRIAGAAFGQEAVKGQVVSQLGGIVGRSSASQFQSIIENANVSEASTIGTIVGVATMIFSATTVFVALQDSLNAMWEVKAKPGKGWLKLIINRVLSLALVVSMGFLLLVSLSVDVVMGIIYDFLQQQFSGLAVYFITAANLLLSLVISTIIFAGIYRFLPDAKIRWKNVWVGAAVTAVLFVLGKFVLNIYFQHDPLADTYGAAGSLVLILVWVYYSAVILLFGAEFTQVYSKAHEKYIEPDDTAVKVKKKEVEIDTDTGQVEVKEKEKGDSL
ncbi:YihY/virulence factor BrkB family protein [Pontibacter liquoris]|uniref:YihY/virulence factor BrkB family protein n=1 Tax=Pontibacter liquoris TaxID=2905677 RepID=UPI001FA7A3B4|nr:YihY/virulence factor BrkB family protein [Pontibacter liquoris]